MYIYLEDNPQYLSSNCFWNCAAKLARWSATQLGSWRLLSRKGAPPFIQLQLFTPEPSSNRGPERGAGARTAASDPAFSRRCNQMITLGTFPILPISLGMKASTFINFAKAADCSCDSCSRSKESETKFEMDWSDEKMQSIKALDFILCKHTFSVYRSDAGYLMVYVM